VKKTKSRETHDHDPKSIAYRLAQAPRPSYLKDFVYGGVDGSVTTFAIVSGVWGAQLSTHTVIVLGIANLFADGFSMAVSNYLGSKAEQESIERFRALERRHILLYPEGEREEIRQIFAQKGITQPTLEEVVKAISSNPERWVDTMLVEEYGVSPIRHSPIKSASATFLAFLICGSIPLVSFVGQRSNPFHAAALATGLTFFLIGSAKSRWSASPWWMSGLHTLAVGSGAAVIAFMVGSVFK
jgi:VIT1/CCC1 family predicted Fe2+/Mn2+ transporter